MTNLADVKAKEEELANKITEIADYLTVETNSVEDAAYTTLVEEKDALETAAAELRDQYNETTISKYQTTDEFTTDPAGEFYKANEFGQLVTSAAVDLSALGTDELKDALFKTEEGVRYIWTDGNTYTFGGSKDYGYGNGYEVSISEATAEGFSKWDGTFPYDIIKPTADGCDVDTTGVVTSFEGLPDLYKIAVSIPSAADLFRESSTAPKFVPNDNAVSKSVQHNYEYALGDVYAIGLSQKVDEISIVDDKYSYDVIGTESATAKIGTRTETENVDTSVGISTGLLEADFYAKVAKGEIGVAGVTWDLSINGVKIETEHTVMKATYEYTGVNINYENSLASYNIVDKPEFKISDENVKTLTSDKVETVAGVGISLQVVDNDTDSGLMKWPDTVLGTGLASGIAELIPLVAWKKAIFGSVSNAESAFDKSQKQSNLNEDRDDEAVTIAASEAVKNFTRLDMNKDSIGMVSYSKAAITAVTRVEEPRTKLNAIRSKLFLSPLDPIETVAARTAGKGTSASEFVISSKHQLVDLSVRTLLSKLNEKKSNIRQVHDLVAGQYYSQYYGATEHIYGKVWFAEKKTEGAANHKSDYKEKTAGLKFSLAEKQYGSLVIDVGTNSIELDSQSADNVYVKQTLNSADKKYSVQVNEKDASLNMGVKTASLAVNGLATEATATKLELKQDVANLVAKTTTINAETKFTTDSAKIELKSDDVAVGKMTVSPTVVKIPQPTVTIGASPNQVKVSGGGVKISGATVEFSGTSMAQIKAAIIKLG